MIILTKHDGIGDYCTEDERFFACDRIVDTLWPLHHDIHYKYTSFIFSAEPSKGSFACYVDTYHHLQALDTRLAEDDLKELRRTGCYNGLLSAIERAPKDNAGMTHITVSHYDSR